MSEKVKAKAAIVGRIEVVEDDDNFKTDLGMVLVFESASDLRAALQSGECKFTFGDPA